jgi:hypothetical protein
MTNTKSTAAAKPAPKLSLDTWAVVIALAAAALIRLGLIAKVPW